MNKLEVISTKTVLYTTAFYTVMQTLALDITCKARQNKK